MQNHFEHSKRGTPFAAFGWIAVAIASHDVLGLIRMFALLVAWVIFAIVMAPANEAASKPVANVEPREWTDASGAKRVRAVLLRVDGEKLWFRRSDGKLTTATIPQLSQADRQYVAMILGAHTADSEKDKTDSNSTGLAPKIIGKITEKVQSLGELPGWTKGSQPESSRKLVPAALVYVRVSREFIEDYVERSVSRRKPVRDYILGARIEGESHTRGRTRLQLLPASGRLRGRLAFEGTVHSRTRGYKSPVVLHQLSEARFRSTKLMTFDQKGLQVTRAATMASTDLRTTSIDVCLPRLRGRIARRIAWRRVAGSNQQAESISSQHTAARISRDFDEQIDRSVAKVKEVFNSKVPEFDGNNQWSRTEMRFRSSPESVEMAMVRREATAEERKLRPPKVSGNPDVAVRMHRAMLTRAMVDPKIQKDFAPIFLKLLNARLSQKDGSSMAGKTSPNDTTKWSFELDWLMLDFMDAAN
jgi:SLA1 homology domain 1, SHD1